MYKVAVIAVLLAAACASKPKETAVEKCYRLYAHTQMSQMSVEDYDWFKASCVCSGRSCELKTR
jgi:hypothetical protein